uniref:Receptor L-domain domain-containing protein n=1 Tax=Glossina brevipalpis TaxID=37001 RepID=A0A1A9X2Q2_9MUSC
MKKMNSLLGWLLLLAIHFHIITFAANMRAENICKTVVIGSIQDFNRMQNCTIVVGHVSIVELYFTKDLLRTVKATNVEEITDYLLVYRVRGLDTLERLLPKLELIRGSDLLFDRYALILNENRDLQNIGLISLQRVLRGSIRVTANPNLCFANTVNWISITGSATSFVLKNNKSPNYCPTCSKHKHCWSIAKPQQSLSLVQKKCQNFLIDQNCADKCISYVKLNKRECITPGDCRKLGLIPFEGECRESCPSNYQEESDAQFSRTCKINCTGNFVVNNENDLKSLADCEKIKGSLTIQLIDKKTKLITKLEKFLGNIKEISGYLKILHSPQLLSLNFLKKLYIIGGQQLIDNKYTLYVVDNYHLEDLWQQKVAILKGRVFFHLNSRLCYEKILQLQSQLKDTSVGNITIRDASRHSNGERVICGNNVHELNATVEDYNSNSVRIKVNPMPAEDKDVLIGYIYYYKIASIHNVTMYDGRHGCGYDNWRMDFSAGKNVRHVLTDLRPYTQYAYFVKTLTITDYHNQVDAYSKIQYFSTLPTKPGPPAKIFHRPLNAQEIEVHWWPPRHPNGVIKHYILMYEVQNETGYDSDFTTKNFIPTIRKEDNAPAFCRCSNLLSEESGPIPTDENYYNKEQLIYDEALSNLIYVPVPIEELKTRTKQRNPTESVIEKENFQKYQHQIEEASLREQDTGPDQFLILKPKSICKNLNATMQFQKENHCQPREFYEGKVIPGNKHSYKISDLQAEVIYRITLRACVESLENNCGPSNTILAETISKRVQTFLQSIKHY